MTTQKAGFPVTQIRATWAYRILVVSLTLAFLTMAALIAIPFIATQRADSLRTQLDDDILAFTEALTEVEGQAQQMQVSVRGYILTQSPAFIEEYQTACDGLETHTQNLVRLAPRVDPTTEEQVDELIRVIGTWQAQHGEQQIRFIQEGNFSAATGDVISGDSQAVFNSFRERVEILRTQSYSIQTELQERIAQTRTIQDLFTTGLSIFGLISLGFVGWGGLWLLRITRDVQQAREQTLKLAEQAREEGVRLQSIFDHSPDGILFVAAPQGQIVMANHAAVALIGSTHTHVELQAHPMINRIYRTGGELCPYDDLPIVRSLTHADEQHKVELIIEQPNGQRVPVLMSSIPLRSEGILLGAIAIFQDLRQLREVERLKSDFVALVSHELRTPLTAILGCAQSILELNGNSDPARTREFVQIIAEQGDRLQELIDNLLNLSQVEAGALRLRRELLQPSDVLRNVLRQMRDRLGGLRVQTDIDPSLPSVSADTRRIEQVLLNLLDNARKFSGPDGLITVSASATQSTVMISVRDQGPGIPPAERMRVFERFYQLEQPTTRNVGGTGLGLAICKALVEAHGGHIWIDDTVTHGTTVCFTLPGVAQERMVGADEATMLVRPVSDKLHVLVIDDDPAIRRLLETGLGDAGYSVQTVMETQTALDVIVKQPPDVVVLDLMLPGMDGFSLCKQLREWTNVPIVMLTARTAEQDVVAGLQGGADDYVTKPFRMNEFLARLEAVLRRTQSTHAMGQRSVIQVDGLVIDLAKRYVTVHNEPVDLTPTEYNILTYLAQHIGQVLTHNQILSQVWGAEYAGETHYLWVHIANLRQKLETPSSNRYIVTERGVGYRLTKR
ncbi:MAG: ATP-binding protein [Chloroflexota bacterium]